MKILFLVYHGFSDSSGISKKIHSQVKALRQNGHEVSLCSYDFSPEGHRCRYIDGRVLADYGTGRMAALRQRTDYKPIFDHCVATATELVYARCFQNASPWLVAFFRRLRRAGIRAVMEVPTYPYDQEFAGYNWDQRLSLAIDKMFRRQLARQLDAIVTFSDETEIFGQRTIRISNGVDLDSLPLHRATGHATPAINMIGVAELHYWHGFDRMIAGMGRYYQQGGRRELRFHIVGDVHPAYMTQGTPFSPPFRDMIDMYGLADRVVFHGQLFGSRLDRVFDGCQFAVGSLGRHRSGISVIKTLKNREYASRGLPFIYSEQDSDFDSQPYILKAPADESPIDMEKIIDFIDHFHTPPADIRRTVEHLAWRQQMQRVVTDISQHEPV
ncbi:MAG: glycosyltransferase family 1 protein [Prevotella sp.]|nr:glycosyltransferase family 1 protein [Prevotella sp.]